MFKPCCLPILIGSLPLNSHEEATDLILTHTPQIPLWPQLPKLQGEGMVRQFLSGFPGLEDNGSDYRINTDQPDFQDQMTAFYEEYFNINETPELLFDSRFALDDDTAKGFSVFTKTIATERDSFQTLKGQVTGPVTTGTGVKDQHNLGIFFDDNLRDMLIKHLALKARWQVEQLQALTKKAQPIIFIDEPVLVSFGSSAFVGISMEMVTEAVAQVVAEIQNAGGLAGVHICANGDWGPVLSSATDIISFDAFFYFENFVLFQEQLVNYLKRGGILAWGIIPTGDPLILKQISSEEIFSKWKSQLQHLSTFGIPQKQIMEQTFIAPSCGTGSLSLELATKVLQLTKEISQRAQDYFTTCS